MSTPDGHRNPQGLAWNGAGELLISEHGQIGRDEINRIRPGVNYGWPLVSGSEKKAGMEPPLLDSGNDTWAPSGFALRARSCLSRRSPPVGCTCSIERLRTQARLHVG